MINKIRIPLKNASFIFFSYFISRSLACHTAYPSCVFITMINTTPMLFKRLYSTSSKNWMSRQARDPYCKLAKANQYRARSAFKLIQINEKYRIIQRNNVVVDCGAAPGGWTQVAAEKVSKKGLVIGIDLLPVDPIPNAHLIQGNFMRLQSQRAIRDILNDRPVDLVCSDMAPSFSGNHTADHARSMELCESALTFAEKVLSPGGSFVAKVYI